MKIKVKDLVANPYRNIDKYPVDRVKVESLKRSIKDTTFWDNILVRKAGKKFEIAYGHHRWIALQELGIKEIDIPCRKLTNAMMIKIMAEENLDWSTSPAVIIETVLAVKRFLDGELEKFETWVSSDKSIRCLFSGQTAFAECRTKGAGRSTILKFLGGNWKAWKVQGALETIELDELPAEEGGVSREAVESLPTMHQATTFRNEVKKHKLPKPTQKKIAKRIADEGIGSRGISAAIEDVIPPERRPKRTPKPLPTFEVFVREVTAEVGRLEPKIMQINKALPVAECSQLAVSGLGLALKELAPAVNSCKEIINAKEKEKTRNTASRTSG